MSLAILNYSYIKEEYFTFFKYMISYITENLDFENVFLEYNRFTNSYNHRLAGS